MEDLEYGLKLKSTTTGKWFWHCDNKGEIRRFTKQAAEARANIWNNEDVAKAAKIPATKKKSKKKVTKKKAKKKVSKKKTSK